MKKVPEQAFDPSELKEDIDPSPRVRKLVADNNRLSRRIDELKLQLGHQEEFFLEVTGAVDRLQPSESKTKEIPEKERKVDNPMSAVLVLGDWHIGEVIDADVIEGINVFDWDIARSRIKHLTTKFMDWVEVGRKTGVIDEAVIVVVGDLISGDIHEELKATNEFPVPEQTVRSGYLLSEAVATIASGFERVRVEFMSADNHSRLSKKYQFKQGGWNSYNYIVGWIARERLSNLENVEFNLYQALKELIQVRNHKYLCMHGHTIKGWSGFPWYGAERQVSREAQVRMMLENKEFDKMIIGHFHVPLNASKFIVNGSLTGTNELDHGVGRSGSPCQVAWLVHPKYGETNWTAFWVEFGDNTDAGDFAKL